MGRNIIEDMKKSDMQKIIDNEHGVDFHRNIDLSGYTVYRGDSFITFRFVTLGENNRVCVYIDYIFVTDKTSLIKLFSWCMNFWAGNGAKCLYYNAHKKKANYVEKTFPTLDFKVIERERKTPWKHEWKSKNGYKENQVIEAFVG